MPDFGGITVSLQSQYDALTIPEHDLPAIPTSSNLITVSIPTYPSSQFWLCYTCPKPLPPLPPDSLASAEHPRIRFYYFKLYVGDECVLSWGVGEQERWSGKTVFGLFDSGTDFEGRKVVEKRGLFFPRYEKGGVVQGEKGFEVRVFRAMGRRKESAKYEKFGELGVRGDGIRMTTTGRVKKGERQRLYTYALIDPKDEPYVIFRYMFQRSEQPREVDPLASSEAGSRTISSSTEEQEADVFIKSPESSSHPASNHITLSPKSSNPRSRTYPRRLSIPPRRPLKPITPPTPHSSPTKRDSISYGVGGGEAREDAVGPERAVLGPGAGTRDREVRTPSPAGVDGSSKYGLVPGTPPSQRKAASAGLLRSVIASATRRKGVREK